ncbi:MAG: hypothetical protein PHU70_07945, partial [Dehalococcoidia bacterium]|nr:hypothetical protein [Dehalococcoidia bacterium]
MLRIKSSFTLILIAALVLLLPSCADMSAHSPSISEVRLSSGLSSDFHPLDDRSDFYVDSPQVCCSVKVTGVSENTAVTADWVCIRGQMSGEADTLMLHDQAACGKDCYAGFTL